jgi:hypothetical protein
VSRSVTDCASSLEQAKISICMKAAQSQHYSPHSLDRRYLRMSQFPHGMSHVFLMIVEEGWVGYNYERFAPSQYIEYGP